MSFLDKILSKSTTLYTRENNFSVNKVEDIKGTVLACVERRAAEYSSRKHYFMDKEGNEVDHPLINNPNPYQSFRDILRQIEYQLAEYGNAYIKYYQDKDNNPKMIILPSASVIPNVEGDNITHYNFNGKNYYKNEIIHFKTLFVDSTVRSMLVGKPKFLNESSILLGTELTMISSANALTQNGGETPYILTSKAEGTNPSKLKQLEQVKEHYNELVPDQFKIKGLLGGDVNIIKLNDPSTVSALLDKVDLETIKQNITEIWQVPRKVLQSDYNGKATTIGTLYGFHEGVINSLVEARLETFNLFFSKHTDIELTLTAKEFSLMETEERRADEAHRLEYGISDLNTVQRERGLEITENKRYQKAGLIEEGESE